MANKVTSFLKKLGTFLAQELPVAASAIPALAPFLNLALPASAQPAAEKVEATVSSEVSLMTQAVVSTETMANAIGSPGLTGAQKAAAAGTGVLQVLLASEAMAGKKIADPAGAQKAAVTIAGGLADFWNAVDGSAVPNTPSA